MNKVATRIISPVSSNYGAPKFPRPAIVPGFHGGVVPNYLTGVALQVEAPINFAQVQDGPPDPVITGLK